MLVSHEGMAITSTHANMKEEGKICKSENFSSSSSSYLSGEKVFLHFVLPLSADKAHLVEREYHSVKESFSVDWKFLFFSTSSWHLRVFARINIICLAGTKKCEHLCECVCFCEEQAGFRDHKFIKTKPPCSTRKGRERKPLRWILSHKERLDFCSKAG